MGRRARLDGDGVVDIVDILLTPSPLNEVQEMKMRKGGARNDVRGSKPRDYPKSET